MIKAPDAMLDELVRFTEDMGMDDVDNDDDNGGRRNSKPPGSSATATTSVVIAQEYRLIVIVIVNFIPLKFTKQICRSGTKMAAPEAIFYAQLPMVSICYKKRCSCSMLPS
jgi:hypothetical protein